MDTQACTDFMTSDNGATALVDPSIEGEGEDEVLCSTLRLPSPVRIRL